ncbi:MAG: hypothetical protein ACLVKO_06945 [Dysgonomonas sp.]
MLQSAIFAFLPLLENRLPVVSFFHFRRDMSEHMIARFGKDILWL